MCARSFIIPTLRALVGARRLLEVCLCGPEHIDVIQHTRSLFQKRRNCCFLEVHEQPLREPHRRFLTGRHITWQLGASRACNGAWPSRWVRRCHPDQVKALRPCNGPETECSHALGQGSHTGTR